MSTIAIPSDVLARLPRTSLVRRLYEGDPKLSTDLTAVVRSKVMGRMDEVKKRLVAEKRL